ncbi:MAG: hypothetical protein ATN35_02975 [Epulopiscium sp. Nele67-Bin004]|nr:MAG: hypothetical protein ATN35_02975 [Epulopiscium sp. Nele67-Bin004]
MDIAALSMSLSQMEAATNVSVAVTKLGLDMMQDAGASMTNIIKDMELSVNPDLGSLIDVRI